MIEEEDGKKIQEIIGGMECSKLFRCAQSGFATLCRAGTSGPEEHLRYLEDDPSQCNFSFTYGRSYYCDCPLRSYLHKRLEACRGRGGAPATTPVTGARMPARIRGATDELGFVT